MHKGYVTAWGQHLRTQGKGNRLLVGCIRACDEKAEFIIWCEEGQGMHLGRPMWNCEQQMAGWADERQGQGPAQF